MNEFSQFKIFGWAEQQRDGEVRISTFVAIPFRKHHYTFGHFENV